MSQAGQLNISDSNLPGNVPITFVGNTGTGQAVNNIFDILGSGGVLTNISGNVLTITAGSSSATTYDADSGSAVPIGNIINFNGTSSQGISSSASGNTVVYTVANATTTTKGVSSFNAAEFSVSAGAVSSNNFTIIAGSGLTGGGALTLGGSITISSGASVPTTFTGNSGTATPAANNINTLGTGSITTVASGSTVTTELTGLTQYNVLLGQGSTTIGLAAPGTAGIPLISQGAASYPSFGTALVVGGGTGSTSFNTNGVIISGTSSTSALSSLSLTDGQIVIGSSAGAPLAANLTAGTGISITNGNNSISIAVNGSVVGETITGNSGGALSPTAGNWSILGTGSITTSGSGSTLTVQLTSLTNHAVLVGAGTATITNVGPTATSGQVLQSQGLSSDPAFSTATYPSTTTINQILYSSAANTVSGLSTANNAILTTGATGVPTLTSLSSNGQLLIGSGSGPPISATLTAGTGISITNGANSISIAVNGSVVGETITGDSGGALSPTAGNWNIIGQQAGSIPVMDTVGSSSTLSIENRTWTTTYIVDGSTTVGLRGTYSTIQSAITAASSPANIFIRPGTYNENLTLKDGVNLISYSSLPATNSTDTQTAIRGTHTLSSGYVNIENINMWQDVSNDAIVTQTGGTLSLINCTIIYSGAPAFVGSSPALLNMFDCDAPNAASGSGCLLNFSSGTVYLEGCLFQNLASPSTMGGSGILYILNTTIEEGVTTSGTAQFVANNSSLGNPNKTYTLGGTGTLQLITNCIITSGTATALSVGTGVTATLTNCVISSSNSAPISGAGTIKMSNVSFIGSGSTVSTTTQTPNISSNDAVKVVTPGAYPYTIQPQDALILVDSSAARTINLHASPVTGEKVIICDNGLNSSVNTITVQGNGSNIAANTSASSYTINSDGASINLIYTGSVWKVV